MANRLFAKLKRWFKKPENRQKAKRAAKTAYRQYKNKGKRKP